MTPTSGNPSGGEAIDRAARDSIRLAHLALERFPELVRRHKFIAGGAAISSSLIVLAGVAIARRMMSGQTPEEAVASVTEDEVQGLRVIPVTPPEDEAELVEGAEPATSEVDVEEAAGNGEDVSAPPPPRPVPTSISRANGAS